MELAEILRFYDRRGYGNTIEAGLRPAVVVIDFSRAFTQGGGDFPGGNFDAELAATAAILKAARPATPVIFTTIAYAADMRDAGLWAAKVPWLAACRAGSPLVGIDPRLAPRDGETVLAKKYPSAFFGTRLHEMLQTRGVDTLIVTGCTTSVCVRATVLDAMQHGYRTRVVRQAVGDFEPAIHALHLADIGARYGDIVELPETLAYLQSVHPA